MDDWLGEDHLARFVVEVIDQLDLSNLTRQYAGRGSKAHHLATLLAILVYGYATGLTQAPNDKEQVQPSALPGRWFAPCLSGCHTHLLPIVY